MISRKSRLRVKGKGSFEEVYMDKQKSNLVAVLIVAGVIGVVLAAYVGVVNSQLSAEKQKAVELNAQVGDLQAQLSSANARYNEQVRLVNDLQNSLSSARTEVDSLRALNNDLQAQLSAFTATSEGVRTPPTAQE
jgi:uncharacterized protein YlxW (UPF0749 family)